MRNLFRLIPAALLGVGAALLVSCGSSGKGLIPLKYAGPLQGDFQAVLQAAQEGDGSCTVTVVRIRKTEHDLQELPTTVDSGLRSRLAEGVANLSSHARELCAQPLAQSTTTSTTTTSAPPATTQTPSTPSTPSTPTTGTAPSQPTESEAEAEQEGGTPAPGAGGGNSGEGQLGESESGGQGAPSGAGGTGQPEAGAGGTGGTGGGQ
ncbi:MAG TPA: hypothetical protein VGL57_04975 [Solirubrobacteraceae bacterium]|jgi:hypothetical protein